MLIPEADVNEKVGWAGSSGRTSVNEEVLSACPCIYMKLVTTKSAWICRA